MVRARTLIARLAACALAAPAAIALAPQFAGQAPPISADRPGFPFAATVVPVGRFQIEAGLATYALTRSGGSETDAWSFPVALRYGLSERWELRASVPTWNDVRVDSSGSVESSDGLSGGEIGAKFALDASAEAPLALLGSLILPGGDEQFAPDDLGYTAFLAHSRDLGGDWHVDLSAGATHTPVGQAPDTTQGLLAALLWRPIGKDWTACVEAAALPGIENTAGQSFAGALVTWCPRPDVQFDLSADFGLDEDSADVIAAFGVSICW